MASTHAYLSASSAHRWLNCTAAPAFEANFPNETSPYAEEGTLAHAICEIFAKRKFGVNLDRKMLTRDLARLKKVSTTTTKCLPQQKHMLTILSKRQ